MNCADETKTMERGNGYFVFKHIVGSEEEHAKFEYFEPSSYEENVCDRQ